MPDIYRELVKLAESDMYPFHMPGHKRNLKSTPLKGAFRCDITEIDGFDNLHDESGIILKAQERANRLYGADETFFLVNGSTCGVLSAVSATTGFEGRIMASRASHRSFFHGAYLRRLNIDYLPVKMIDEYGVYDGYTKEDVERAFKDAKELPQALFITSPTYEGKCSDIEGIAKACHKRGIPLIVDAAHGAHFGFGGGVPKSAVSQGADLVIHSLHKTLPSMTQTALLHLNGRLIDREKVKKFLRIYQSSSPSYVFMASIDLCMKEMEEHGEDFIKKLVEYRKKIGIGVSKCRFLRVPEVSEFEDPAKILISTCSDTMTGQCLYDILRKDYKLQLEMAGEKYALAIISGWDTDEGIDRLISAICEVDARVFSESGNLIDTPNVGKSVRCKEHSNSEYHLPRMELRLADAWEREKEFVPIREAEGRIAGEFVNLYPPGIPLIAPGEVFGRRLIEDIERYEAQNLNLQGIIDVENEANKGIIGISRRGFLCVKQK